MHWTRMGIIGASALAILSVFLPWLTNVPPGVLEIGEGTILGVTTVQGLIAAGCACGAIVIAVFVGKREFRVHRGAGAGLIALAIVAIGIGSLVLGTSHAGLLDEAEAQILDAGGTQHVANLAVIELSKTLEAHPIKEGAGQIPFALGCVLLALFGIIGMFLKGEPKQPSPYTTD